MSVPFTPASGVTSVQKEGVRGSRPKPKGGAVNIVEPKAKKGGHLTVNVKVDKIVHLGTSDRPRYRNGERSKP